MNGSEFERKIKRLGRRCGVAVTFDRGHGKVAMGGYITASDLRH